MNSLDSEYRASIGQKERKEREPEQIVIRAGRAKYYDASRIRKKRY